MIVNRKTCNLQPKWIWPAAALVLTDPSLLEFTLLKSVNFPESSYAQTNILIATMLISGISLALLPRKVANMSFAAALPLAGSIAFANYFFNS